MAKPSNTSKSLETPGDSMTSETLVATNSAPLAALSESVNTVVQAYFVPLAKAADKAKRLATTAQQVAANNLHGKKEDFNEAEEAVNAYEEILNNNANPLAKKMEKIAAEIEGINAKAAESAKSLATANVAIKTAKEKIAPAKLAADALYALVKKGWQDDRGNFEKILSKMGGDAKTAEERIKLVIHTYVNKIQAASNKLNEILLESNKIDAKVISDNKLKELSQKAKTLTDGFKSDITANLEFSKNQLKQTHADFIKNAGGDLDATSYLEATDNEVEMLKRTQQFIAE